ncbi:bestrophin RFP-TM (chloride channel) [Chitinophaga niastensis]|uniref:Bestrophin RFP-TM (Chloride channel) n=1 Tax=Chitinophaga niastensis TaxID=536980 RepID=A0A2P8HKN1_CHINA|nr:bestrophin family ion channel [Chitinophaga niastensis]PSL46772.1 bestrophin RFP-TM (chloride channel) [Chitinophaga niastensis]
MINYNPKEWFTFIFRIHKADTVRKLFPMFIALSVYSGIVAWLELEVWRPSFTAVCGACERIRNTPIPFSYSVFIKKIIFFYVMSMPFGYVFSLGYLIIPMIVFIFFVLASLELITEEIEDPFGKDPNDLPLDTICGNIRLHVAELL